MNNYAKVSARSAETNLLCLHNSLTLCHEYSRDENEMPTKLVFFLTVSLAAIYNVPHLWKMNYVAANWIVELEKCEYLATWRVIGSSFFESAVIENIEFAAGISFLSVIWRWIREFTFGDSIFTLLPSINTDSTSRCKGAQSHVTKQLMAYHREVIYEQKSPCFTAKAVLETKLWTKNQAGVFPHCSNKIWYILELFVFSLRRNNYEWRKLFQAFSKFVIRLLPHSAIQAYQMYAWSDQLFQHALSRNFIIGKKRNGSHRDVISEN